jgi:hypothetical protein
MSRSVKQRWRGWAVAAGAALVVLVFAGQAAATPLEDDMQNGRLGYKWVPDPPKRPLTPQEELGVEVAKYGGGGLIVLWLLKRMFSTE